MQIIHDSIIETRPDARGIGMYYLPEELEDFELYIEWKAFRQPAFPNAGLLLRMPDPATVDFTDQAAFDNFYQATTEIQIDDLGKNFNANNIPQAIFGDSLYKTGAVYGVASATQWAATVWAPDGDASANRYWNVYQIKAAQNIVTVKLNGKQVAEAVLTNPKRPKGLLGLQFHTGRVQFRNLHLKKNTP
jgi:hypothetical protein